MRKIEWNDKNTARLWNYYSSKSNGNKDITYFGYHSGESLVKYIKKNGIDMSNKIICDFGCGNGYLKQWIKEAWPSAEYIGVEFAQESIEVIKNNFDIEIYHISEMLDGKNEGRFDIILATELLEHLTDKYLEEDISIWKSLLRKDGTIIITTPNDERLENNEIYCPNCDCVFHKWQHIRKWDSKSIAEYFESRGFVTEWCKETMLYSLQMNRWYKLFTRCGRMLKTIFNIPKANPNLIYVCKKNRV